MTEFAPSRVVEDMDVHSDTCGEIAFNQIIVGNAPSILRRLPPSSVDLSFWSPPYHVGKSYERDQTFDEWKKLLQDTVSCHASILREGSFLVVNISDILCFADPNMPRFQANNVNGKKQRVTRKDVLAARELHPNASRYRLAELLGCSEQTIQRRLEHNNVRGGKVNPATKVLLTGSMIAEWAESSGLYLYDRRIWRKDPCWMNSRWHSTSYRAVDEFEYLYVYWKPGIVSYERDRLTAAEWAEWGSRGVWEIASVRRNRRHEAEFPEILAERVIRLFSPENGVVIDPFVGTGTTTTVAKRLGRSWLGIDLDPGYAAAARKRTPGAHGTCRHVAGRAGSSILSSAGRHHIQGRDRPAAGHR